MSNIKSISSFALGLIVGLVGAVTVAVLSATALVALADGGGGSHVDDNQIVQQIERIYVGDCNGSILSVEGENAIDNPDDTLLGESNVFAVDILQDGTQVCVDSVIFERSN